MNAKCSGKNSEENHYEEENSDNDNKDFKHEEEEERGEEEEVEEEEEGQDLFFNNLFGKTYITKCGSHLAFSFAKKIAGDLALFYR
jgi:hypothetical protein